MRERILKYLFSNQLMAFCLSPFLLLWPLELLLKAGTVPILPKYGFTTLGGSN